MENRYRAPEEKLEYYTVHRASGPVTVDGNLGKPVWRSVPRTAFLWDEKALYVGFWAEEPQVRASLTDRDSYIWFDNDNDVEVFFAGEDCYYEFEINALDTVYEVFFIHRDAFKKGSRFDIPEFDLYDRKVDGVINDPSKVDKGWTVELAFPWEGEVLRASFSRFEALRYQGKTGAESAAWALNENGVYDSHVPEFFSYLHSGGILR